MEQNEVQSMKKGALAHLTKSSLILIIWRDESKSRASRNPDSSPFGFEDTPRNSIILYQDNAITWCVFNLSYPVPSGVLLAMTQDIAP